VDQELIEYLDRRFNQLRSEVVGEIRGEIAASAAVTHSTLREEIAASAAETRTTLREEIVASAAETRTTLREEIVASAAETRTTLREEIVASAVETRTTRREEVAASAAETRRHFDVVAEQLMSEIQLVAEGVIGVDQKVDRLAADMRTEFQNVDRRILHLEARVLNRD
jgi:hypothetical protein